MRAGLPSISMRREDCLEVDEEDGSSFCFCFPPLTLLLASGRTPSEGRGVEELLLILKEKEKELKDRRIDVEFEDKKLITSSFQHITVISILSNQAGCMCLAQDRQRSESTSNLTSIDEKELQHRQSLLNRLTDVRIDK